MTTKSRRWKSRLADGALAPRLCREYLHASLELIQYRLLAGLLGEQSPGRQCHAERNSTTEDPTTTFPRAGMDFRTKAVDDAMNSRCRDGRRMRGNALGCKPRIEPTARGCPSGHDCGPSAHRLSCSEPAPLDIRLPPPLPSGQ